VYLAPGLEPSLRQKTISDNLYKEMLNNTSIDAAFKATSEPRRREILRLLGAGELSAGEIASRFDVTQPAISQHLSVLAQAGLVVARKDGTKRMYRAVPQRIEEIRAYLAGFWAIGLDRLKAEAESEQRRMNDASTN
jgi:DNA-binding transcriptional ArsR family regulator